LALSRREEVEPRGGRPGEEVDPARCAGRAPLHRIVIDAGRQRECASFGGHDRPRATNQDLEVKTEGDLDEVDRYVTVPTSRPEKADSGLTANLDRALP